MDPPHLLYGDERVLWEGRPPSGFRLRARDAVITPFFLLWTGMVVIGEAMPGNGVAGWFARLWGAPFLLLGRYMSVGRLLHDAHVRGRQRYRVTTRRVLVERVGRGGDVRSLAIDRLPLLAMTERADGSGDLRFEPKRYDAGKGGRPVERDGDAPALSSLVQFLGIADVRSVYDLIDRAAKER